MLHSSRSRTESFMQFFDRCICDISTLDAADRRGDLHCYLSLPEGRYMVNTRRDDVFDVSVPMIDFSTFVDSSPPPPLALALRSAFASLWAVCGALANSLKRLLAMVVNQEEIEHEYT